MTTGFLDEVSNVHGHLVDACVVEFLYIVKGAFVVVSHEVHRNTLTAETTTPTDPKRHK